MAYSHGDDLTLRAAVYTGIRQPTLNELYRPFAVFPVTTRANAALANERLQGFEAGLDFVAADGFLLSATLFDDRLKWAVANVTIAANLRERRNVDAIHAQGVELGLPARQGALRFEGSLAWTRSRVKAGGTSAALDGMRPAQTPELSVSATLGWSPRKNWDLALTLRHTGAQFEDDLQTDVLPAATTLNAVARIPVADGFTLVLRGENLTDREVITRNQGGSVDLGLPRTLWAGVSVALP